MLLKGWSKSCLIKTFLFCLYRNPQSKVIIVLHWSNVDNDNDVHTCQENIHPRFNFNCHLDIDQFWIIIRNMLIISRSIQFALIFLDEVVSISLPCNIIVTLLLPKLDEIAIKYYILVPLYDWLWDYSCKARRL